MQEFNIWSTTNQERPILVHCKFIYQDFYGNPIRRNPEDSVGFRIPRRGFRIPVSQFRIPLEGFRISRAKFWISKPWIPSSTSKHFLDSSGKNGNGL